MHMNVNEINLQLQEMWEHERNQEIADLFDFLEQERLEEERQQYEHHMQMYACHSHDRHNS
jgi:hypothetical protein